MASFNLNERRLPVFQKIAALDKASVNAMFVALANVKPAALPASFPLDVALTLTDMSQSDAAEIVATLHSLFAPFASSSKSLDGFIDDIVVSFGRISDRKAGAKPEECDRLRDNLKKLLSAPAFGLGAKASGVLLENERNFILSRIVTEVRPVFGVEDAEIAGAVVLHSLRISYIKDNEREEFFVAIDSDDLAKLIVDLERAKRKEEKVKEMLFAGKVAYMGHSRT